MESLAKFPQSRHASDSFAYHVGWWTIRPLHNVHLTVSLNIFKCWYIPQIPWCNVYFGHIHGSSHVKEQNLPSMDKQMAACNVGAGGKEKASKPWQPALESLTITEKMALVVASIIYAQQPRITTSSWEEEGWDSQQGKEKGKLYNLKTVAKLQGLCETTTTTTGIPQMWTIFQKTFPELQIRWICWSRYKADHWQIQSQSNMVFTSKNR